MSVTIVFERLTLSFQIFTPKCARHGLTIGSKTVPLVKIIIFILYPVAKPLAFCLDFALGAELATIYSNSEMTKLLQIHVQHNVIDKETAGAMTGALTYKVRTSTASSVVTTTVGPNDEIFFDRTLQSRTS